MKQLLGVLMLVFAATIFAACDDPVNESTPTQELGRVAIMVTDAPEGWMSTSDWQQARDIAFHVGHVDDGIDGRIARFDTVLTKIRALDVAEWAKQIAINMAIAQVIAEPMYERFPPNSFGLFKVLEAADQNAMRVPQYQEKLTYLNNNATDLPTETLLPVLERFREAKGDSSLLQFRKFEQVVE